MSSEYAWSFNQEIEEYDDAGNRIREFVYRQGIDQPVWIKDMTLSTTDKRRYPRTDRQGTVIAITKRGGALEEKYTYDAWGKPGESSSQPVRYTGRRYDNETGLYYYRARYYSPALGRFLQTDPIGTVGGMNLYGYVGNNPANFTDPFGLFPAGPKGPKPIQNPFGFGTKSNVVAGFGVSAVNVKGVEASLFASLQVQPLTITEFETFILIPTNFQIATSSPPDPNSGPIDGLNDSGDAFIGMIMGDIEGDTENINIVTGPVSTTVITKNGSVVGGTLGAGPSLLPGGFSKGPSRTHVLFDLVGFLSSFFNAGSEKTAITKVCDEDGNGCIEFRDGAASPSSGGGGFASLATDSTLCIFTGGELGCEDR